MAQGKQKCLLCSTVLEDGDPGELKQGANQMVKLYAVQNGKQLIQCRTCGNYIVNWGKPWVAALMEYFGEEIKSAVADSKETAVDSKALTYRQHTRMVSWFTRQHWERNQRPFQVEVKHIESPEEQLGIKRPTVTAKLDLLLLHVGGCSKYAGDCVTVASTVDWPITYSESPDEFEWLIKAMNDRQWAKHAAHDQQQEAKYAVDQRKSVKGLSLTPLGWEHFETLQQSTPNGSRALVCLWFHQSTETLWEKGIVSALSANGYEPIRLDHEPHNELIIDKILSEVRRASLVVADLTGHRNGVYFEAGFAMGLGTPVIWTCHKDDVENTHTDVKPYNVITWETPEQLAELLRLRISALYPRNGSNV